MTKQEELSKVKETSKQGREAESQRWSWVEAEVWTERMLTTLETGVKGGKWFSLIDKVYSKPSLEAAWRKVRRRKGAGGVDGQSTRKFEKRSDTELEQLHQELKDGRYRPRAVRRHWIDKGGGKKRPLGIPTVRDRVVQTSLRQVLEPIFEKKFCQHSYGFRPQRSCKDALREAQKRLDEGYHWVVDADIEKYFDCIDPEILMKEVEKEVSDGRVLKLIRSYLEQEVLEGMKTWKPERGTPQGAVISPLLANIYLHPVDEEMERVRKVMIRYADDVVILCRNETQARKALRKLRKELEQRGLRLNLDKTRVVDARQKGGFDFLGYHFERGHKWARKRSEKKLRDRVRSLTRRTNGHSLKQTIETLDPILRGWFEYFQHGHPNTFKWMDGWVRGRLRSLLRKRRKRRGRARGYDHQRWPNAYFIEQGLFTMTIAHAQICQSRCGPH
jgi:RNA-directed DNA polymerase